MKWEDLTSAEFKRAVKETGVCIISLGVIEKHGDHLPLGTDVINVYRTACLAAEKEPAVVFMPYYFGQIYEAKCFPGTIAIKPSLLFELLQEVLDEIGRNGFKKIIMVNGHGGNNDFLRFFNQCTLWNEKSYSVYLYQPGIDYTDVMEEFSLHAGEWETSFMLANAPHLVKTDRIPKEAVTSLRRMEKIPNTYAGIWWYAAFPEHYGGDANLATLKKGEIILQREVDELSRYIAAVKADTVVPALNKEFFDRGRKLND